MFLNRNKRGFLKLGIISILVIAFSGLAIPALAGRPTVRILSFNQGFLWPDIFGKSGVERTERLKQFEEKEGINVEMEWGDETAVRQKVAMDLIAHAGRYDILLVGSEAGVNTYGPAGFLEPLDRYFKEHPTEYYDPSDVYPQTLNANRIRGVLYALPYFAFGAGLIHRADIIAKYGLTLPRTTDQLMELLESLKTGLEGEGITDVYPVTMRAAPGEEPTLDLSGFVYAWAGYPAWFEGGVISPPEIKEKKAKPIFNQDFAPGFRAFTDISKKYGPPGISTHTWVDQRTIYGQGKAVLLMPNSIVGYSALNITEDENVKKYTRFAKIPVGPSGKQIQSFWTMSFGINRDSKDKVSAWKVLSFLTGKGSIEGFASKTQRPNTPMKSVLYSDWLVNLFGLDQIKLNEEALLEADPYYFPQIPELSEFVDMIGTACSQVVSGQKTVEKALDDLQIWALERMLKAGYYR